ncbi:HpcH/HpaI aldolase [Catenulispora acidiphila DSM 44928]|uniref:HpcH/HpaI aldolase n=1 Tax=Catenulispora acidiphila (strain DSM 44928 / JCM 14897 / NBRC 102108 / NRRL B-24433 / ID139908) TaxID=479433 RepID=C7QEN0_CATAD|nr:aldolase/citrate lyase family protein [Catenulispora acidiphila]ACU72800.1 HpcH/HpaI aldolase [Catenulispora acidiphila DSM 44928]
MARLNKVIDALAAGRHVFASFAAPEPSEALAFATSDYDALIFETEHKPWDGPALRDSLQYLLDRRQIRESDNPAPGITPLVRIPVNGAELAQWHAKQALDMGAFGVVWPHISRVAEARNAVAACRYPSLPGSPRHEPVGLRGDSPAAAARYWGITNQEYYARSDVWPLDPDGEVLVALMIEDQLAIENLPDILDQVSGVGLIIVGEGDMSQELGIPRQYDHPRMAECKQQILKICGARGVAVGHPHVTAANVEQVLADGYRFLASAPVRTFPGLALGRSLTAG